MDKFTTLEGVAAPLKIINVDTDMIIPKQYLKTIKRTGLGKGLFSEQRYKDDGSENPDFVLNKPSYRKAKILEVGCGLGYLTHALKTAGHDIRGLDISSSAVEAAKQTYGPYYVCADVNVFPATTDERFDIIVMTEVVEHLEEPLAVLSSLRALLKPGGVALVSTPSKDFLPQSAVWRTDNPPVHLAWYSKTSLREMARRTQFRISFADFRGYNTAKVAGLEAPRDLASGAGAFRLSPDNQPLDTLSPPRTETFVNQALPDLRRIERRAKYIRRALELYAEQADVLGAIFQRVD